MDAKKELSQFKEILDKELKKYFSLKIAEAKKVSPFAGELMEHIADITMRGGKRIRAAILYYSYLAHGGKNKSKALKAALSMELMQTYLLIHDDIIDNDSIRRGGPTIHKVYEKISQDRYPEENNGKRFGISAAILAGDMACALSNQLIAKSGFDLKDTARAIDELNNTYTQEVFGEFLDSLSELRDDIKQKDVILTHRLKTVPYTFDGPVKIGAILAGRSDKEIKNLENYTIPLGIAFQIQDDILGMFGSEEKLGKPVTSDLREGKKTLLILDCLDKATKNQKNIIKSHLGNRSVNVSGLELVRGVIKDTLALKKSISLANKYVKEATEGLEKLRLSKEGKNFLLGIADYMVKREY